MAQSYSNFGGTGNRTTNITVTTTATLGGSGGIVVLIDGAQADSMWFGSGQSGREVKFDFGYARLITEAIWYQDVVGTHGTWQWQGSPDNSTWTSIGSTFTLGSPATQTITTLSGNATSYRYYRMLQTAGTTSSSPFLREVEFLIDDVPFTSPGPYTTWSPVDRTVSLTLSNANLTAATSANNQSVRAADKQTSGKFYFEITCTTIGTSFAVGLMAGTPALGGGSTVGTITVVSSSGGPIRLDGVNTSVSIGTFTNGALLCMAFDIDNQLAWFRVGAAGNWNGNAGYAPNTGVGGVSFASLGSPSAFSYYPYATVNNTGNSITANFGDTAFTGTVPTGFTSGFPSGAAGVNAGLLTQIGTEVWTTREPVGQLTQIGIEVWEIATSVGYLTQIGLETWASVAGVSVGVLSASGIGTLTAVNPGTFTAATMTAAGSGQLLAEGVTIVAAGTGGPMITVVF